MSSHVGTEWLKVLEELRRERVNSIRKLQELRKTKVFVFWNLDELVRQDFFVLADMLEDENPSADVDLVVLSPGGSGEAGFRIGHTFQGWCRKRDLDFRVVIPLYAMSAATVLALGAHEIVMGLQSEIGPIDPQFRRRNPQTGQFRYVPAMAVIDGLKLIGEHIEKMGLLE